MQRLADTPSRRAAITDEAQVEALVARIQKEQDRLDVLVNSIAGEEPLITYGSFWDVDRTHADLILRQSLVSHVVRAQARGAGDDSSEAGG